MRVVILFLILVVSKISASANPIVYDSDHVPMRMLSERVHLSVGEGRSIVKGLFRFEQQPMLPRGKHVTIFVPVLFPDEMEVGDYLRVHGRPRIEIRGRKFAASLWNDIALDGAPAEVPLPRGWTMLFFVCDVPLKYVSDRFEAKVSFVQPHFPQGISAYVPIEPPQDLRGSVVIFEAEPGLLLKRVPRFPFPSPARKVVRITPKDRKLIRVKVGRESGR